MTWAMEASHYSSFDFSFQSSFLDLIDFNKTRLLPQPCFEEIYESSSLDNISAFETEKHGLHAIVEGGVLDDGYMDMFMFMEKDLNVNPNLDVVFSVIQDPMASLEQSISKKIECELNQSHENVPLVEEQYNAEPCDLKEIKEELEETSLTEMLLRGAEAVEAANWQLASTIIARLNYLLLEQDNAESNFNRLAFFFTQGLHYKCIKADEPIESHADNMLTFQMLQEIAPYIKFAHFTANQAILEATEGEPEVHVLDFDVMEGIQWPPLMVDLALRKNASLRITAIIDRQQLGSQCDSIKRTGRRLGEFANSVNLDFRFDQLLMEKEEDLEGIELGRPLIANCMIHQLHMPNRSFRLVKDFLRGVRKLFPKIVVLVEEELFNFAKIPSKSFVQFFCNALHHYSALSDSLSSGFCGGSVMGLRMIEQEFLGVRIMGCLQWFLSESRKKNIWGNGLLLQGFKAIPLSTSNVSQAKLLVGLFSGGYGVQHENCRLALCWKSRPLTTATIWVPS